MDKLSQKQHYKPLFTLLTIGSNEYAVLDQTLASERAAIYLSRALYLMEQETAERYANTINYELLIATDLGSSDAAFLLASRTLQPDSRVPFPPEDAVIFLKLAADRGHAESAYQLGCCYSAIGHFKQTENTCANYFAGVEAAERQHLAEYYFQLAADKEHREGIEELIIAYAYGRGYIEKNADKFRILCEKLIANGDQAVAVGYGAWLAGITVEGNEPLPEAIQVMPDYNRAIDFLILGSAGSNIELGQHALHLISLVLLQNGWDNLPEGKLDKKLHQSAATGNQLLALYFAWYSLPIHKRGNMPELLECSQLTQLANFVEQDEEQACAYLDKVLAGTNMHLSAIARDILQKTFACKRLRVERELLTN